MRDALMADISALVDIEIVTTVDVRVKASNLTSIYTLTIDASANPMEIWQALIKTCDAALIVAPESDGVLSKLTHMVEASGVVNLGCGQRSVDITSNKYDTFFELKSAGVETISTMKADDFLAVGFNEVSSSQNGFVLKPIDGVGCDQTMFFKNQASVQDWLSQMHSQSHRFIVQPFHAGIPASMSILCRDGLAWLLSCNLQNIVIEDAQHIKLIGIIVNGLSAMYDDFEDLADHIAAAMPSLNGYVGVDLILHETELVVVEINPRITSSYIGLSESLECNPMCMILELADAKNAAFALPKKMLRKSVSLSLNV